MKKAKNQNKKSYKLKINILITILSFLLFIPIEIRSQVPGLDYTKEMIPPEFDFDDRDVVDAMTYDNLFIPSYGLIINSYDIECDDSNVLSVSARPWLSMDLGRRSLFYIRGKETYSFFPLKEEGLDADDKNVIDLDIAFYKRTLWITNSQVLNLCVGRQFICLGNGLLLNGRADGMVASYRFSFYEMTLLGAYSGLLQKDSNPFNLSDKDFSDGARRMFLGVSFGPSVYNQAIKLLYLYEKDFSKKSNNVYYEYTVSYVGLSIAGNIINNLDYCIEAIYEFGKSHLEGSSDTSDVKAYGATAEIYYFLEAKTRPKISIGYAYGSGDKNRKSATSPVGNESSDDKSFIHFGTFQKGLSLHPSLSNLRVMDIGLSILPFAMSQSRILRQLQLILRYLRYMKAEAEGGINDGEALDNSNDVGHGVDISAGWRLSAELSIMAAYGYFKPGKAYPSYENDRSIILCGFTLSI